MLPINLYSISSPILLTNNIYGPSLCPGSGARGILPNGTGALELGSTPYRPYVFWSTLT
jgi:hypothetical protein